MGYLAEIPAPELREERIAFGDPAQIELVRFEHTNGGWWFELFADGHSEGHLWHVSQSEVAEHGKATILVGADALGDHAVYGEWKAEIDAWIDDHAEEITEQLAVLHGAEVRG